MKWVRAGTLVAAGLSCAASQAHRIDEYLQATLLMVESEHVVGTMRLIPGKVLAPSVIAAIDSDGDGLFSQAEQRAYAQRVLDDLSINIDAIATRPKLLSWYFPAPAQLRAGLGEVLIDYTVAFPTHEGDRSFVLLNRHRSEQSVYLVNVLAPAEATTRILHQIRSASQSSYELDFFLGPGDLVNEHSPRLATWSEVPGLNSLFQFGMHHIADGTDHLLFLLVLLLPAPLMAAGGRWGPPASASRSLQNLLAIVTAFTAGHSITLTLAAMGGWRLPTRPVEILVALSILVSAAHALRPIFPGREYVVAALFGLVHGLAFAAALDRLGLGLWARLAGSLSFNLGIEAMQLLVIFAVMPSLWLMSRTPAYRAVRIGGVMIAGLASAAWMVGGLLGIDSHVDSHIDSIARVLNGHAQQLAGAIFILALGCFVRYQSSNRRADPFYEMQPKGGLK